MCGRAHGCTDINLGVIMLCVMSHLPRRHTAGLSFACAFVVGVKHCLANAVYSAQ